MIWSTRHIKLEMCHALYVDRTSRRLSNKSELWNKSMPLAGDRNTQAQTMVCQFLEKVEERERPHLSRVKEEGNIFFAFFFFTEFYGVARISVQLRRNETRGSSLAIFLGDKST